MDLTPHTRKRKLGVSRVHTQSEKVNLRYLFLRFENNDRVV